MLVPGQSQKGIPAIHEITGQQRVGVHDGRQRVNDWPGMEVDNKKYLEAQEDNVLIICSAETKILTVSSGV